MDIKTIEAPEEQDLIVKSFSLDEFEGMICNGQIKDAATLAAYTLLNCVC